MTYKEEKGIEIRKKVNTLLLTLPGFCEEYVIGRENKLAPYTLLSYVYKLSIFLTYLVEKDAICSQKTITELTIEDLKHLETKDIELFDHWLKDHHLYDEKSVTKKVNKPITIENYLACLNSFWKFFCDRKILSNNPILVMDRYSPPKKKKIIKLNGNEENKFLDTVEFGTNLTPRQLVYHEKNQIRDVAICRTLLYTGIRVSELVGLDVSNVDFELHKLSVYRKGNNYDEVYFDDDTEVYLMEYLNIREMYHPPEDENALFVNKYGLRMGVRSIEKLVKKYAQTSLPYKPDPITPHKLRSTYATNMLNKTENLALVQDQLGHASPETTRIYGTLESETKEKNRNVLLDK